MHVITRRRLREFWAKHPHARAPLTAWFAIVSRKTYADPHELKADFASASVVGDYRTVFNIGGNRYRLVVRVHYSSHKVYVVGAFTHAEYDEDRWKCEC